ncbi:no mechanoreceptor potential C [Carabus blaptoides fortunei]
MEPVLKLISESQIQIAMKEHDLLYRAVQNGDLNMTQLLCKYGADINQRCRNGRWTGSPLRCALRNRNVEIATWLLENGATPLSVYKVGEALCAIISGRHFIKKI